MATFESITWQAVGVIATMLSVLGAAVVWAFNKVYGFGKTSERINNIERILEVEYREKFRVIDKRFNRVEDHFVRLEEKIDYGFKQIDERFDKLYNLLLKKQ